MFSVTAIKSQRKNNTWLKGQLSWREHTEMKIDSSFSQTPPFATIIKLGNQKSVWCTDLVVCYYKRKIAAKEKWWRACACSSCVIWGRLLKSYRDLAFSFEQIVRNILSLTSFLDLKWLDCRNHFTWVIVHASESNQGNLEDYDRWEIKKGYQQRMHIAS